MVTKFVLMSRPFRTASEMDEQTDTKLNCIYGHQITLHIPHTIRHAAKIYTKLDEEASTHKSAKTHVINVFVTRDL